MGYISHSHTPRRVFPLKKGVWVQMPNMPITDKLDLIVWGRVVILVFLLMAVSCWPISWTDMEKGFIQNILIIS